MPSAATDIARQNGGIVLTMASPLDDTTRTIAHAVVTVAAAGVGAILGGATGTVAGRGSGRPVMGAFVGGAAGAALAMAAPAVADRLYEPRRLQQMSPEARSAYVLQMARLVLADARTHADEWSRSNPTKPLPQPMSRRLNEARALVRCLEGMSSAAPGSATCTLGNIPAVSVRAPYYPHGILQAGIGIGLCGAFGAAGGAKLGEYRSEGAEAAMAAAGGGAGMLVGLALIWVATMLSRPPSSSIVTAGPVPYDSGPENGRELRSLPP